MLCARCPYWTPVGQGSLGLALDDPEFPTEEPAEAHGPKRADWPEGRSVPTVDKQTNKQTTTTAKSKLRTTT